MNKKYILVLAYIAVILSPRVSMATIEWSGTSMNHVFNEDLIIRGDCQFTNQSYDVRADATDVTIYIDADATIKGRIEGAADDSILYLIAFYPYTITVKVNHRLRFEGTFCELERYLQIVEQGSGSIKWEIDPDDGKLEFTADDSSGGTQLWIEFNSSDGAPDHSFVVTKKNQVYFGPRSTWGYRILGCNQDVLETVIEKNNTEDHHEMFFGFKDLSSFALELYQN